MTKSVLVTAMTASLAGVLCLAPPASGQTTGEARVSFVEGRDSEFRFRGFTGGAGVLFYNRVGLEGEFGAMVDNSEEGVLMPAVSLGGNVRLASSGRLVPFLSTGFMRFGDTGSWYGGGGAHLRLSSHAALRFELRGAVPIASFSGCVPNARTVCDDNGRTTVFAGAGLTFGFGR